MRVLVTPYSARSHLYGMTALAWALRTAGHEVRVTCHPDEVEWVTSAGLTAVPVGTELHIDRLMQRPDVLDGLRHDIAERRPEKLTWDYVHGVWQWYTNSLFRNVTDESTMDETVWFARAWRPDLVIWDPLNLSGPVAARVTGSAHARLLFGLDFGARMRRVFLDLQRERPSHRRDDPLADWLGTTLARYGASFDEELLVGHWTIDPLPRRMRLPLDLTYVTMRYVPFNGPCDLPEWVRQPPARPRVCVTLGISGRELFGEDGLPVTDLLTEIARLDVEVVATVSATQLDRTRKLPDNVRVVDFVPLQALLPTCSAVVHHGGMTTIGTAINAEVPQLVVYTKVWDKADAARYVRDRGGGITLDSDTFTVSELTDELSRLLGDQSFSDGARAMRRETLAAPTPNDIVPILERLTEAHARIAPVPC